MTDSKRFEGLQILRFLAASMVIVDHAIGDGIRHWAAGSYIGLQHLAWTMGDVGVLLFFGISGLLMVHTQHDRFGSAANAADFFARRIIRIVPLYTLATLLQYANKARQGTAPTLDQLFKSLAFLPYLSDAEPGLYRPVLGQGWTLNFEMFFYAAFAIAMLAPRRMGLAACAGVFAALGLAGLANVPAPEPFAFYLSASVLFFAVGMAVATWCEDREVVVGQLGTDIFLVILAIAIACAIGASWPDTAAASLVHLAMVALMLVIGVADRNTLAGPAAARLVHLGNVSYSTYLFHGFVLGGMKGISSRIPEGNLVLLAAWIVAAVLVGNAAGAIVNRLVEAPLTAALTQRYRARRRTG